MDSMLAVMAIQILTLNLTYLTEIERCSHKIILKYYEKFLNWITYMFENWADGTYTLKFLRLALEWNGTQMNI